jgi:hypothetical protein
MAVRMPTCSQTREHACACMCACVHVSMCACVHVCMHVPLRSCPQHAWLALVSCADSSLLISNAGRIARHCVATLCMHARHTVPVRASAHPVSLTDCLPHPATLTPWQASHTCMPHTPACLTRMHASHACIPHIATPRAPARCCSVGCAGASACASALHPRR